MMRKEDVTLTVQDMEFASIGSFNFDEPDFNTFRFGAKWADKVKPGETLKCVMLDNGDGEGDWNFYAVVSSVTAGPYKDMKEQHEAENHGVKSGLDLDGELREAYGRVPNRHELVTVVHMVSIRQ